MLTSTLVRGAGQQPVLLDQASPVRCCYAQEQGFFAACLGLSTPSKTQISLKILGSCTEQMCCINMPYYRILIEQPQFGSPGFEGPSTTTKPPLSPTPRSQVFKLVESAVWRPARRTEGHATAQRSALKPSDRQRISCPRLPVERLRRTWRKCKN